METTTEILKKQEVHQVNIGGIVYEMVKFAQAEKAMLEYADIANKNFVQPVVMGSGTLPKCPKCNDRFWLYDNEGNRIGGCECHYT